MMQGYDNDGVVVVVDWQQMARGPMCNGHKQRYRSASLVSTTSTYMVRHHQLNHHLHLLRELSPSSK
jgi:hypothetical protein